MRNMQESREKIISQLNSIVVPLNSVELYSDYDGLDYLGKRTKHAKIVALGEVTHGSSEIFKMKTKIARYLIETCGFNVFAMEANMPEAYRLNDYVLRGKGDPKKLLAGMIFWTWNTQEVLDFIKWMRKYNVNHSKKVMFAGFDMQYYSGAISELRRICIDCKAEYIVKSLNDLEVNLDKRNQVRNYKITHYTKKEWQYFRKEVYTLREFGNKNIKDPADKTWFLQCVRIIEQSITFSRNLKNMDYRDKCMAENLLWIANNTAGSKIITWAHNWHIQKKGKVMGYYISKQIKQKYMVIGFAVNIGEYTALHLKTLKLSVYSLRTPPTNSYEYYLHLVGKPLFLLDFKRLNLNAESGKLFKKKLKFRSLGSVFYPREFYRQSIIGCFDMLVFIEKSSPTKLLQKH